MEPCAKVKRRSRVLYNNDNVIVMMPARLPQGEVVMTMTLSLSCAIETTMHSCFREHVVLFNNIIMRAWRLRAGAELTRCDTQVC